MLIAIPSHHYYFVLVRDWSGASRSQELLSQTTQIMLYIAAGKLVTQRMK